MKIEAVIFDLDGTLVDSRDLILNSFHYACDTVLGRRLPDEQLLELVGVPLMEQMQTLAPDSAEELVQAYRENNRLCHDELIQYFPGTREVLAELAVAGLPMAVVTSKLHKFALAGLEIFNLEGYFEFLIGADDCASHKPDPGPLLLAAERLGRKPARCVYVGDSPYDMRAAVAAGMRALGAQWGMFTPEELTAAGAEQIASDISDVPKAVRSFSRFSPAELRAPQS